MAFDRFIIAPFNSGLETNTKPWLITEDAFSELNNAYVFRGRVRKRFGGIWMGTTQLASRLRINLGNTNAITGNFNLTPVPAVGGLWKIGQLFSVGTQLFTVYQASGAMLATTGTGTGTFNTATGALVITGAAAATAVFFYPSEPVMGITQYESGPVNNQPTFAFDTRYAYEFSGGAWTRSGSSTVPTWHGNDLNFFWDTNWRGISAANTNLFVTNYQANIGLGLVTDDPIWTFERPRSPEWQPFSYSPDATINTTNTQPITVTRTTMTTNPNDTIAAYVQTARIIVEFKDRLLLLNTIENNALNATAAPTGITPANYLMSTNTKFGNRCRFSHNGNPYAQNAWLEPSVRYDNGTTTAKADGAGFIDATTQEEIVSAEFIKDRLIVFFERSTWELVYTGNQVQPFVWQKINTELGSESQFSVVPFDKAVIAIGNTGVHACSGANVERIDNKIPDKVFQFLDKNLGTERVAGVRDFFVEMVYWSFPVTSQPPTSSFPSKVLVYNYANGSWAFNDDCITTFGYFEQQLDTTWATAPGTWEEANFTWVDGVVASQFRQVLAGNQQGYVFIVNSEISRNAAVMQITNIIDDGTGNTQLTIIDHNLDEGDFILIESAEGITSLNDQIFQIVEIVGVDNVVVTNPFSGTYTGGGTATRVSRIQMNSKQFNPYVDKGRNVYVARIDFGVLKTDSGRLTIDYFPSATELSMVDQGSATNALMGTNVLETSPYALVPLEEISARLWHPIYFQTEGECIQLAMYLSDTQMVDPDIALAPFELEGMVLHTQPTAVRLQ